MSNIGAYFTQTDSIETTDIAVEEETGAEVFRQIEIDREARRRNLRDTKADRGMERCREANIRNLMEKEAERRIISTETSRGNDLDTEVEKRMETIPEEMVEPEEDNIDKTTDPGTRTGRYTQLTVRGLEHIKMQKSSQAGLPEVQ